MNPAWFARHDWPMDHEIQRRNDLMDAIRALPNGETLSDEKVEGQAIFLWSASNFGRIEELPCNRPASQKASEVELERLAKIAAQLADHIEAMHRPAVAAIWKESADDLWTTAQRARDLSEAAKHAAGVIDAEDSARGAGKKVEAEEVAEMAGHVFEHVTGRRPTLTVAPDDGQVSGVWPDFLARVFTTLRVKASPNWQARAVMQKYHPERGN